MADIAKDNAASAPRTIYLKDYQPPAYLVDEISLRFELEPVTTRVNSRLTIRRNPNAAVTDNQLQLHGQDLELVAVRVNGTALDAADYQLDEE